MRVTLPGKDEGEHFTYQATRKLLGRFPGGGGCSWILFVPKKSAPRLTKSKGALSKHYKVDTSKVPVYSLAGAQCANSSFSLGQTG